MADKPHAADPATAPAQAPAPTAQAPAAPAPPRRPPGHRGADMRDTVAEMAERAQLISQEAGSKVAAAMKDVISAAAGLTGFAIESARDLVQYMVRRGQMTPEEAEKLMREAEAAHERRPASERSRPTASKIAAERAAVAKAEAAARVAAQLAAMPSYRQPIVAKSETLPPIDAAHPKSAKTTAVPGKPHTTVHASPTPKPHSKPAAKAKATPKAKPPRAAKTGKAGKTNAARKGATRKSKR